MKFAKPIFSKKERENIITLSFTEYDQNVVKVKASHLLKTPIASISFLLRYENCCETDSNCV